MLCRYYADRSHNPSFASSSLKGDETNSPSESSIVTQPMQQDPSELSLANVSFYLDFNVSQRYFPRESYSYLPREGRLLRSKDFHFHEPSNLRQDILSSHTRSRHVIYPSRGSASSTTLPFSLSDSLPSSSLSPISLQPQQCKITTPSLHIFNYFSPADVPKDRN